MEREDSRLALLDPKGPDLDHSVINISTSQEEDMTGYIYRITNLVTNKNYVGCTIQPPMRRWKSHINEALAGKTQMLLHKSIRKHGEDNFVFEVLEEATRDILYEREKFWIAKLSTVQPDGYNIHSGGRGGSLNASPELRAKFSAAKKGRKTWNAGLTKSDPRVAKNCVAISKALKGRVFTEEHKRKLSIAQKKRSVDSVARSTVSATKD